MTSNCQFFLFLFSHYVLHTWLTRLAVVCVAICTPVHVLVLGDGEEGGRDIFALLVELLMGKREKSN